MIDRVETYSKATDFEGIINLDALLETLYPFPILVGEQGIIGRDESGALIGIKLRLDKTPLPMLSAVHIKLDRTGSSIISILDHLLQKKLLFLAHTQTPNTNIIFLTFSLSFSLSSPPPPPFPLYLEYLSIRVCV